MNRNCARHVVYRAAIEFVLSTKILASTLCLASVLACAIIAATRNFVPDFVFQGSSVAGLHTLGQAEWRAVQGEIIATPHGDLGGWLVLDKSYQDIEFSTEFRCSARCDAGVLLRAEKTNDGGLKGVYVSLNEGDLNTYDLTIGPDGKELNRKRLEHATGQFTRIAAGPGPTDQPMFPDSPNRLPRLPNKESNQRRPQRLRLPGLGGEGDLRLLEIRANDWNSFDVIVDMDMVWITLNGRRGPNTATNDRMMGYGPIALHVGGAGEVRFRDLSAKDLNPKTEPEEKSSSHFREQRLNDFFYSWGATAGDINHDGIPDVIAGPFYFLGPDYTERHEFTAARSYSPSNFPGRSYVLRLRLHG